MQKKNGNRRIIVHIHTHSKKRKKLTCTNAAGKPSSNK